MKVAALGGGPAGLYSAISMKLRDPNHEVTVFERNKPDDTQGWGFDLRFETEVTDIDTLAAEYDLVVAAMRAAWPEEKLMSVRISATDCIGECGVQGEEAVQIATMFRAAGVDSVDISAGQTSVEAEPLHGRMFQTPFSDHIRNEQGIPRVAVGNIYEPDHVNSIPMAGGPDRVCLARPHLADPYWTLHAAAALGDSPTSWPAPCRPRRDQMQRLSERGEDMGIRV